MMLKRGLMQLLLAALLLAAQYSALTHQTRHLQDRLPAQTQQHDKKQKSAHVGLCDFHVSFAEVIGAVNCTKILLKLASYTAEQSRNHLPRAFPANLVVPASRGPPELL